MLVVNLEDVKIGSDLKTVVTLEITNPNGLPIHPNILIGISFMLVSIEVDDTKGQSHYNKDFTRLWEARHILSTRRRFSPQWSSGRTPNVRAVEHGRKSAHESTSTPLGRRSRPTTTEAREWDPVGDDRHRESMSNIVYAFVPTEAR